MRVYSRESVYVLVSYREEKSVGVGVTQLFFVCMKSLAMAGDGRWGFLDAAMRLYTIVKGNL